MARTLYPNKAVKNNRMERIKGDGGNEVTTSWATLSTRAQSLCDLQGPMNPREVGEGGTIRFKIHTRSICIITINCLIKCL